MALNDASGNSLATYYYDAFGNILSQTGTFNNNITYAGYQYDSETGLYYLNSRMYDPITARFLTEDTYAGDPNDPLSLNGYTYCHNEPVMYIDPDGHMEIIEGERESEFVINAGVDYSSVDLSGFSSFVNNGNADNVLVAVGSTVAVTNYANIGSLSIGDNSNANVINNANIDTFSVGNNVITCMTNNGKIKTANLGESSLTIINNNQEIDTINSAKESSTIIVNNNKVGVFNTGGNSKNFVDNNADFGSINTGQGNTTNVNSKYKIQTGGNGTIVDLNNGTKSDYDVVSHNYVVAFLYGYMRVVEERTGITPNFFIPGAGTHGKNGYADLVDTKTREIWEVKPISWSSGENSQKAKDQLSRYIKYQEGYRAGDSIPELNKAVLPYGTSKYIQLYTMPIKTETGLIYYSVKGKLGQNETAYDMDTIKVTNNNENLIKAVETAGAGYVIYRGARMVPSLLPPFWPSIPANALCP